MRAHVVDPSAFTPPYDHALCRALARQGVEVTLVTSRFAYGAVPSPDGYAVSEPFYRAWPGRPGTLQRTASKLAQHVPDMLRYRRLAAQRADVVHFQWLDLQLLDGFLLPARPIVLTAHDLLPREPRPGQVRGQRRLFQRVDAVVVHSRYGRDQLVDRVGVAPDRVHVIPHGALTHLVGDPAGDALPPELPPGPEPVILFFGLLRPYKGLEVLLRAFAGMTGARLWIVGRPRMELAPLRALASDAVTFVPRFVSDYELAACFRAADVVVLPYSRTERFDQSGVLAAALAFAKPIVLTSVGGFPEVAATGAAQLIAPGDEHQLRAALTRLVADPAARERLSAAARDAAAGPYSWEQAARRTVALYRQLLR